MAAITSVSVSVGFATGAKWSPQPHQDVQDQMSPEELKMMQAMEKYATPGKQHEQLARRVGNWTAEIKHWPAPGAPAETMTGTAKFMPIMDGRYILQEFEGVTPWGPFSGIGLSAYDNLKQKYQSMWIDNMSTGLMVAEGDMQGTDLVTMGDMPDPIQGKFVKTKSIERMVNDDTLIMEMHAPGPDGKHFKMMEITYTRLKTGSTR